MGLYKTPRGELSTCIGQHRRRGLLCVMIARSDVI